MPSEQGQFKKGTSGNPGGRPKGLRSLLLDRYGLRGEKLLNALEETAFASPDLTLRFRALQYLCDQFWGKPLESIEHSGEIAMPAVTYRAPSAEPIDLAALFTVSPTDPPTVQ